MKKTLLTTLLIFSCYYSIAQVNSQSIKVVDKTVDFDLSVLDQIDFSMIDLYRSKTVDNTITIWKDDKYVLIVLESSATLDSKGISYEKGLVEKGAIMSGEKALISRSFTMKVENDKNLVDTTVY